VFEHPNRLHHAQPTATTPINESKLKEETVDNTRYICLEFETEQACVIHGFAGYFDSQLYQDVYISK
jgi:protein arginine N-methyltransferase 5